jgi:hypothetical protein
MSAPDGALAAALLRLTEFGERLDELDKAVRALAEQVGAQIAEPPAQGYEPAPTVQWWRLSAEERTEEIKRLRSWTETVYVPGYGHLSAALPPCWAEHDLCLYTLDWLAELWAALYVATGEERSKSALAGQAEFQTRILAAAVEQMKREVDGCEHARVTANGHRPSAAAWRGGTR